MQTLRRPALAGPLLALALGAVLTAPSRSLAQAAAFVGSESCAACHPAEQAAWRGSDHRQAMLPADAESVRGDFDDARVVFHGVDSRLFRDGERYRVTTAGPGGERASFDIAYTFGHYPVQQYLVDVGRGYLQALNLAWDSRASEDGGQRWYHLRADEEIDANHPFFWTRHFQNANSRCIECHSTGFRKNFDPESTAFSTAWAEPGVGCEACHGPASRHLELAAANRLDAEHSGFERRPAAELGWSFEGGASIASPGAGGATAGHRPLYRAKCTGRSSRDSSAASSS